MPAIPPSRHLGVMPSVALGRRGLQCGAVVGAACLSVQRLYAEARSSGRFVMRCGAMLRTETLRTANRPEGWNALFPALAGPPCMRKD
jgi:hypothetical protein